MRVLITGTMPSGMLQHETTRSFTDADKQAAMVKNLGVCNDRSAYTGKTEHCLY